MLSYEVFALVGAGHQKFERYPQIVERADEAQMQILVLDLAARRDEERQISGA